MAVYPSRGRFGEYLASGAYAVSKQVSVLVLPAALKDDDSLAGVGTLQGFLLPKPDE